LATSTSHIEIDGPVTFSPPRGDRIAAHAIDLALEREDGMLREVRLTFSVPPETYATIDREEWFNLEQTMRGPGSDSFEPESDVQIEARLDASLLPAVAAMGPDILDAGAGFATLVAGSPLLETESWYALHVTVEVLRDAQGGSLREGYSTFHTGTDGLRLPMLAIAEGVLEERDLDWSDTTDPEVIRADISGENGEWALFIVAREDDNRVTVYSQAPWETPEPVRAEMAELLTRINFGLPLGNFELDFSDGEVRFKTSLDLAGAPLRTELFEGLLDPNIATTDMYLPAIEAVVHGRMTPKAAVEMVEG
jgi:hypothetical protein